MQLLFTLLLVYFICKRGRGGAGRNGGIPKPVPNPPRVLKNIPYPSQTRLIHFYPIPLGAGRGGYPKKPAPLPSLSIWNKTSHSFTTTKIVYNDVHFLGAFKKCQHFQPTMVLARRLGNNSAYCINSWRFIKASLKNSLFYI